MCLLFFPFLNKKVCASILCLLHYCILGLGFGEENGTNNPRLYVKGSQIKKTCILDTISERSCPHLNVISKTGSYILTDVENWEFGEPLERRGKFCMRGEDEGTNYWKMDLVNCSSRWSPMSLTLYFYAFAVFSHTEEGWFVDLLEFVNTVAMWLLGLDPKIH